jgi:hypothetical protein
MNRNYNNLLAGPVTAAALKAIASLHLPKIPEAPKSKGKNNRPQRTASPKAGHKATHQVPRSKPRAVTVQRSEAAGVDIGYVLAVALILATMVFVILGFVMLDAASSVTASS